MDHDLARLGAREFEHVVQALAKHVLGPGVRVFGDGRDGGRDADFDGTVPYTSHGGQWNGYGVVQAKFRGRPGGRPADVVWLEGEIRKELADWASVGSRGERLPQYLLFATNVVLSPAAGNGGIDRIDAFVAEQAAQLDLPLRGWAVWHFDEICRFLDMYPGIRQTVAGLVVPGDVLAPLVAAGRDRGDAAEAARTAAGLRAYTAAELVADQWVRLGQAGAEPDRGRIGLGRVAVDLRARRSAVGTAAGEVVSTAAHVIGRGEACLRPSAREGTEARHLLLVGGPGQGKSTLSQLICQAYRVSFLDGDGGGLPTAQAREVHRSLRRELAGIGLPVPNVRRLPLRIVLHDYASALRSDEHLGVLDFLARQLARRSVEVSAAALGRSLRTSPWLLLLDGLDEVAPRQTRELVMGRIEEFLLTAGAMDADLLVVGTTRPQGYNGEFHQGDYETLRLRDLTTEEALHYAGRLARARHQDDPDLLDTVENRIEAAARDAHTARLMRSPLQVTIMSLLVEKRARMPQNRYELFEAYYGTVYAREADKPGPTGQLLAESQAHVDWLHQYVGLHLQASEAVTEPTDVPALERTNVERALQDRLLTETEDEERSRSLAAELVEAATDRLVLLVAPEQGAIGFEVKSLQEYCAARALLSGPDKDIVPRLGPLARDDSWQHTWLLTAAGLFTHRPHLRSELITLLREVDALDPAAMTLLPGAGLALELLHQDIARRHPRYQQLLVQHAAELIGSPLGYTFFYTSVAPVLEDVAARSEEARRYVENAARKALAGHEVRTVFSYRTVLRWTKGTGPLAEAARELLHEAEGRMTPEQRAAIRLFIAAELNGRSLPGGLAGHLPEEPGVSTDLASVIAAALPAGGRSRSDSVLRAEARDWVETWLADQSVTVRTVDGITVPLVEEFPTFPMDCRWEWEWLSHAQQLCIEAAEAQPATGWSVVKVLHDFLAGVAYYDFALEPTVVGITDLPGAG
ncbi:NACHT domain-containing protein [Kitasatospora sp. NPDC003701]